MSPGEIIMQTIAKADAIEYGMMKKRGTGWIFIWKADAEEQIQTALRQLGYELKRVN